MAKRYNGIHRHQLFHWIGSHIDYPGHGSKRPRWPLEDQQRHQYLDCLRGVLRPGKGLWVKPPREPDRLGDGSLVRVDRPILCFTEWSLDESLPHTMRYGRLGLGFPKQFVLRHGGQPVTYVRDRTRLDPFTRSMMTLARHLRATDSKRDPEIGQAFAYISQFLKRIDKPAPTRASRPRVRRAPVARAHPPLHDPFRRPFGSTLEYLEEREWRIVFHPALDDQLIAGSGTPPYYLPIRPGTDLFTAVLPDNRTVNMALNDRRLRRLLWPKDAPHVTLLSLEDVGTF